MPKSDSRQPLRRQWHLLTLVPQYAPGMTSRALKQALGDHGFDVEKRTVERDLCMLEELGLVERTDSMPCQWRQLRHSQITPAMTTAEALSLTLLEQQLKPLLPVSLLGVLDAQFKRARALVENDRSFNRHAKLIDKIRLIPPCFTLMPPQISPDVLNVIQHAVAEETPIRISYQGLKDPSENDRDLMPLALLQQGSITYLIARDPDSNNEKLFALHRMKKAALLYDQPYTISSAFDLDAYLAAGHGQFFTQDIYNLHALVSEKLARVLSETPTSPTMKLFRNTNDKWEIVDSLTDTALLRSWIAGQQENLIEI